jgi:restriction endonuclease Mrr
MEVETEDTLAPLRFPLPNLEEVADEYLEAYRQKILQKLQDLSPEQFERFASVLMTAYGFINVTVTGRVGDGGIDGHGRLKVGLATMNVAFQCKRWQGQVGRPEIDRFRGAISGEFQQGILFTTSDFSEPAREASLKQGTVPIVLVNGDAIVQLMIETRLMPCLKMAKTRDPGCRGVRGQDRGHQSTARVTVSAFTVREAGSGFRILRQCST